MSIPPKESFLESRKSLSDSKTSVDILDPGPCKSQNPISITNESSIVNTKFDVSCYEMFCLSLIIAIIY